MGTAADSGAFAFRDGVLTGTLDLTVYRMAAIKKAAYRVADATVIHIGSPEAERVPVTLTFAGNVSEGAAVETGRRFLRELLDQELREQVRGETESLRVLILAHAFSKTGLVREP